MFGVVFSFWKYFTFDFRCHSSLGFLTYILFLKYFIYKIGLFVEIREVRTLKVSFEKFFHSDTENEI